MICLDRRVVLLETYHGASTIILRILDWLLWIIEMLDLLVQPHNSRPYVRIGTQSRYVKKTAVRWCHDLPFTSTSVDIRYELS
jgi:hypothetical protein